VIPDLPLGALVGLAGVALVVVRRSRRRVSDGIVMSGGANDRTTLSS
jgi:hypothetical protein